MAKKKKTEVVTPSKIDVIDVIDEREGKPSASSMDVDMRCTSSRGFVEQLIKEGVIKPPEDSKESARGTRIHASLHKGIDDILSEDEKRTRDIIAFFEAKTIDELNISHDYVWREERFWARGLDDEKLFSAKPDVVVYSKHNDTLVSINYKTGMSELIPIEENYQVITELLCSIENVNNKLGFTPKHIIGCTIQPFMKPIVQKRMWTHQELSEYRREFEVKTGKILGVNTEFTAGTYQCKYCAGRFHCPLMKPVLKQYTCLDDFDLAHRTPTERGDIYAKAKIASKVLDSLIDELKEYAKKGELGGYKMVTGSMNRFFDNYKKGVDILKKYGISDEAIEEASSFSMTVVNDTDVREKIITDLIKAGVVKQSTKNEVRYE